MFKVPDWGNDTPKGNAEAINLFTNNKRKKPKSNVHSKIKSKSTNKEIITKKKSMKATKNTKTKVNGYAKLSKDDHINNRIMRRNQKLNLGETKHNMTENRSTGNVSLKRDNPLKAHDVSDKMKSKLLKRKGKSNKCKTNVKSSETIKSELCNKNIDKNLKSLKRKQTQNENTVNTTAANYIVLQSLNSDKPDKILVNAKRKKMNDKAETEEIDLFGSSNSTEHEVSVNVQTGKKIQKKKEKLKELLNKNSNRNVIKTSGNNLRLRMLEKLKAAQFRYLNEKLYTASGSESQELFKSDPAAFQTYHQGYQQQVKKWPVNPLDLIVKRIQKMPKTHLVADMGCGEAALSKRVSQTVRSFDLVAANPQVEACDMAHTPLLAASMDVVVYCLALMGTDLTQYLLEANRVLKIGGHLLIAEVESRFDNADTFTSEVQRLGFGLKKLDRSHQVFLFLEFIKQREAPAKRGKLPVLTLKPCLYKRR